MNLSRFVPRFLLLVGTVWFGPALHAQAAAGGVDVGSLLNPAVALNSLPTELAKFYPIFQVIGFLLLCIGLVVSLIASNSVQDNIKAVVKACLLTGTIALIPVISGQISSMASGVAQGFDQSGLDTATNLLTTSIKLNEYFQQSSQIGNGSAHAAEQAKQASWWQVPIVYMKGAIQDVKQGVVSMLTLISYIPESLARFCLFLVCMLGVLITYMVQYILGMVQYFLLNAALIFMPVFVAGLGTQFYRSQSANFISGWIGVACWPIGWGL